MQSHSDREFEEEEDTPGISRSRLKINDARNRFEPAAVDARGVDFSDRLDGKRKSYKVSSRGRRVLKDGTEELGDLSDDGDEKLARKVARLKRQLEEVKEEVERQAQKTEEPQASEIEQHLEELTSLSSVLDEVSIHTTNAQTRKATAGEAKARRPGAAEDVEVLEEAGNATYTITYTPSYQQTHALMKAADFDRRLGMLEKAIGIGSSAVPELESDSLPRAIMPTLDTLQKQISILSEASVSSLDSIARRARTLTQEADNLAKARQSAKQAKEALDGSQLPKHDPASESSEQTTKINALYGTLPTIEGLSPLLPALLDRLRSLRAIHSEAASASDALDKIEKRQIEMAEDIKQWKDGLERVEKAMSEGSETMDSNKKVIEGWVKDLQKRLADLD